MNLHWSTLTPAQRQALLILCQDGPAELPEELGEQLRALGLAEKLLIGFYCASSLAYSMTPATIH